jgi:hypothetical protein
MASNRTIEKEIAALKKEIAGLRSEYAKTGRKTAAAANAGAGRLGAIKDEIADRVSDIKESLAGSAGGVADDIAEQLEELREMVSEYSGQAGKAMTNHPFATAGAALAIGYLIGRMSR